MYGRLPYTRRMATKTKTERLELRLTLEQKLAIELAASIEGRSLTDFSVQHLVREANKVIRDENRIVLSPEAWEAFQAELARPPRVIPELVELFSRPDIFVD